jgi:hypothetical protein
MEKIGILRIGIAMRVPKLDPFDHVTDHMIESLFPFKPN